MSDTSVIPRPYHTPEPFSRPLSSIVVIPTLEPIPQSAVPTPAARESPEGGSPAPDTKRAVDDQAELADALEGVSLQRNPSINKRVQGSYFALAPLASSSGLTTPGGRPRPNIAIPPSTPDQPLFSAYPKQGATSTRNPPDSSAYRLLPRHSTKPPLTPKSRLRIKRQDSHASDGGESATSEDDGAIENNRRRSASLLLKQRRPFGKGQSPKSALGRRRAGSLGARNASEYHEGDDEAWRQMARAELNRLRPESAEPFTYNELAEQADSDQPAGPLGSPPISPRRSSLIGIDAPYEVPEGRVISIPDGLVKPHEPPARRSSLDLSSVTALTALTAIRKEEEIATRPATESQSAVSSSVLSSSLSCSDPSIFSPTSSSQEHPLSSATTSLSRSAKSAKEGTDERDAALSAVKLQRSLEWEAKQNKRRRRLDKRKMVLLELVETEVAYAEALRALVQVYLPQLAALPSVSERTASMIARNSADLLEFHANLATRMVAILKAEHIVYDILHDPDAPVERAARRIAALFVEHSTMFSAYKQFCAGSIAAATLVRHIGHRTDYDAFERRCQIIWATYPQVGLKDLLLSGTPDNEISNRSRLHFRDYLIMPIQRICRYPLLLASLRNTALTPSVENHDSDSDDSHTVGVDVEAALERMRQVASESDEARRIKEAEVKSATIVERLEPHVALSPAFIKSLGTCRLIGSLDVLHHHHIIAPLVPPVKVKYLAAFLYRGYLILAKVKKGKTYEAKHFLPLEVFELIDLAEGYLPHSVRLTLRDHNFDLAASCEAEKDVWAAALREARDEGVVPPFELPASVSPFAARARRGSTAPMPESSSVGSSPNQNLAVDLSSSPLASTVEMPPSDMTTTTSPGTSLGLSITSSRPSALLLRRTSGNARLQVDHGLLDVFSESCAQARSKAQLSHPLFLPDHPSTEIRHRMSIRDSTMLRRRTSFLDHRSNASDIAFNGEVKGSVIPVRQTRSHHGRARMPQARRNSIGDDSATDFGISADETITNSDYGQGGHRRTSSGYTTAMSNPTTPSHLSENHRFSMSDLDPQRPLRPSSVDFTASRPLTGHKLSLRIRGQTPTLNRRKTASSANLQAKAAQSRARSMPVSPAGSPNLSETPPPVPPKPQRHSSDWSNSRSISYFPLNTEVDADSIPGLGLMKASMEEERPKWGTLRRSMSFLRNRTDEPVSTSPASYMSPSASLPSRSSDAIAGLATSSSSTGLVGGSESLHSRSSDGHVTPGDEDVTLSFPESGSAPNTPKRKKSLLLSRLMGFTAM